MILNKLQKHNMDKINTPEGSSRSGESLEYYGVDLPQPF